MSQKRIGVFGGTFDPVHKGHTKLAKSAYEECVFDELFVVPCALPPHRSLANATSQQRIDMLSLAFSGFDNTTISDYELNKKSLSYSIETLEFFQSEQPKAQLFFCLGADSLASFSSWYRWQDILGIANLVVMHRSGFSIEGIDSKLLEKAQFNKLDFSEPQIRGSYGNTSVASPGKISMLNVDELSVSATEIRQSLDKFKSNGLSKVEDDEYLNQWLDPKVLNYISQNKVYQ